MPDASGPRHGASAALFTAPNLITFGRLCAVPLAFWLILEHRLDQARACLAIHLEHALALDGDLA